jgi:two-component system, OmpR family, phosphate regulon sensor histidine kinase PhoR
MKSKTLRYIILLAAISVAGVFLIQFGFIKTSYNFSEKKFKESTSVALKEVAWQILLASGNTSSFDSLSPVEIVSGSYYLVNINSAIDKDLLKMHLIEQFKNHEIYNDFEFAIYNPVTEQMDEGILISNGEEKPSEYVFQTNEKYTIILAYIFQTAQLFLFRSYLSGTF